jgi:hypothetical protein
MDKIAINFLPRCGAGGSSTRWWRVGAWCWRSTTARQVPERLPDGGARVSYTQEVHVFHVKRADGIAALCMADDRSQKLALELFIVTARQLLTGTTCTRTRSAMTSTGGS